MTQYIKGYLSAIFYVWIVCRDFRAPQLEKKRAADLANKLIEKLLFRVDIDAVLNTAEEMFCRNPNRTYNEMEFFAWLCSKQKAPSCANSCSPSDWKKSGKCDLSKCFNGD